MAETADGGKVMKIIIESTSQIVNASGIDCRVWEGSTESGIRVHCLIPRIAVRDDQDTTQFEAELKEQRAPSVDAIRACPLRLVL
ncbi:MAG: hypothetical protein NVS1B14_01670 [Vulcanimicrobiaceae bacterium]